MSNTLIYSMSTMGSIRLDMFNELFRHVYTPASLKDNDIIDVDARRQAVRILDSLGYCEFDFDKRMVFMCKPSFVLLPGCGLPKALLVGARTPDLENKLKTIVKDYKQKAVLHFIQHKGIQIAIPPAIVIESANIEIIYEIAEKVNISCQLDFPAAWGLLNMSKSLKDIEDSLTYRPYQ